MRVRHRPVRVSPAVVLKTAARVARHPWVVRRIVALGLEREFFPLLHPRRRKGVARRIRQVAIRITDRCNLRCHTCGQWGERGYLLDEDLAAFRRVEVPASRYAELFRDLVAHRHRPIIYFWGGEPMLYEGLLDLVDEAVSLRLPVAIASNGTRVAEAARRLVGAPVYLLQLSIDGHTAALHDELRPSAGPPRNFSDIDRALDAVVEAKRVAGRGLPIVTALTVVSQANIGHLADIYDTFRSRVDLFVFYLSWWIDEAHADLHEAAFEQRFRQRAPLVRSWIGGWKPDDYARLAASIRTLADKSRGVTAPPVTVMPPVHDAGALEAYYTDHDERFGFDECASIFQMVEINSNGDVSPCRDYHDYVVGNVKEATISELWNSERYRAFRRSLQVDGLLPACSRCCGLMGF